MTFGSVIYALSLALSGSVLVFLFYDEPWNSEKLLGLGLMALALFTGIFVRNKCYNLAIVAMIAYASYEIYHYSRFQGASKTSTQLKNDAVIIGIFAYLGWILTGTYLLWKVGEFLARWKAKSPALTHNSKD